MILKIMCASRQMIFLFSEARKMVIILWSGWQEVRRVGTRRDAHSDEEHLRAYGGSCIFLFNL